MTYLILTYLRNQLSDLHLQLLSSSNVICAEFYGQKFKHSNVSHGTWKHDTWLIASGNLPLNQKWKGNSKNLKLTIKISDFNKSIELDSVLKGNTSRLIVFIISFKMICTFNCMWGRQKKKNLSYIMSLLQLN